MNFVLVAVILAVLLLFLYILYMKTKSKIIDPNKEFLSIMVDNNIDDIIFDKHVNEMIIISWNIERGYKLQDIIKQLKVYKPDILILQECDINCERSNNRNIVIDIMRGLNMKYCVFGMEFIEHKSLFRSTRNQGGGKHGNAIISKYEIIEGYKCNHRFVPLDWNSMFWNTVIFRQPRSGYRNYLCCKIRVHESIEFLVYCLHLECICGINDRLTQFKEVLNDVKVHQKHNKSLYTIIGGDFNTLINGWIKWIPIYWESRWNRKLMEKVMNCVKECKDKRPEAFLFEKHLDEWMKNEFNMKYMLKDPWNKERNSIKDATVMKWCYHGKLDWILVESQRYDKIEQFIGGDNASDHQLVGVKLRGFIRIL